MILRSDKFVAAAGRIGENILAMYQGRITVRSYVVPSNTISAPKTSAQTVLRQAAVWWASTLSEARRAAWRRWAGTLRTRDSLGLPVVWRGHLAYCASMSIRRRWAVTAQHNGPVVDGFDTFTPVSVGCNAATRVVRIYFSSADPWVREVGGGLVIQSGPVPMGMGVERYYGPYRNDVCILGTGSAVPNPYLYNMPPGWWYPGAKHAFRFRSFRADGRFSVPQLAFGINDV